MASNNIEKVYSPRKVVPLSSKTMRIQKHSLTHSHSESYNNKLETAPIRSMTLAGKGSNKSDKQSPEKTDGDSGIKRSANALNSYLDYEKVVDLKKQIYKRKEKKMKASRKLTLGKNGRVKRQKSAETKKTSPIFQSMKVSTGSMDLDVVEHKLCKDDENSVKKEDENVMNGSGQQERLSTPQTKRGSNQSGKLRIKKTLDYYNEREFETLPGELSSAKRLLSSPAGGQSSRLDGEEDGDNKAIKVMRVNSEDQVLDNRFTTTCISICILNWALKQPSQ